MSDNQHIRPDFRHVLTQSDKERLQFIEQPRWLQYATAKAILGRLEWLLNFPKRSKMPNLLIIGDSNNGKTSIVDAFYKAHGLSATASNTDADPKPTRPIVLAEAPPSADKKALYISLLEQFQAPYRPTQPAIQLYDQNLKLFRLCSTKILIIDEFHNLYTGTPFKQRETMNAIKNLCNSLKIPLVGVGTREAVQVIRHDPQHTSRFTVIQLPLWKPDREFQTLITAFESVLPLRKPSQLYLTETARLLHDYSGGNLGDLHLLLTECAKEAIETGAERIDLPLIEKHKWIKRTLPKHDNWKMPDGIRELKVQP